jgi:molybdenum cofactor synthesis domain-containing protein
VGDEPLDGEATTAGQAGGALSLVKDFQHYLSLAESVRTLRRKVEVRPRREIVPLGLAHGRVLFEDVVSRQDIPPMDSAHMDGFAVRSSDLRGATADHPVRLRIVKGSALGAVPKRRLLEGEAHSVLTGGFLPQGANAVLQSERVQVSGRGVSVTWEAERGEFIYLKGEDVKRGETVLRAGRTIRGTDQVLLGSLHYDRVPVFAKPRVAIVPTGNELSDRIRDTEPGKVAESHSFLLSRLVEGAGGVPVRLPIARDDTGEVTMAIRAGLRVADLVLTVAGSSVSESDITEESINAAGKPGVLVHGMKVTRGRVMGFGVCGRKAVIILPGPIQGALNAFIVMAYPLIRAHLGRGFEAPPSLPARMGVAWDAGRRFRDFTKVVYVRTSARGDAITAYASSGQTEKMTFLTQSDGYVLVDEQTVSLKRGDQVRVFQLPGLSPIA